MAELLNISSHDEGGIGGIVNGRGYDVLLLNYLPRLHWDRIDDMQRHLETDECFVLLEGRAVLFLAAGEERPGELEHCELEKGKIYTVPRNVWHTQTMTENAKILLVECSGTVAENSPRCPVSPEQKEQIARWGRHIFD